MEEEEEFDELSMTFRGEQQPTTTTKKTNL